jgi:hypothetical protein
MRIASVLLLPIYQIANLVAYAKTRDGWVARVATVVAFLPIMAVTTTLWAMSRALAIWLAWRLIN